MTVPSMHPYAPPGDSPTSPEGHVPVSLWSRLWSLATPWYLFFVSVALFALSIPLFLLMPSMWDVVVGPWFLGLATGIALLGGMRAFIGVLILFSTGQASAAALAGLVASAFVNGATGFIGFFLTIMSSGDFRRGRQIRRFGKVLLPEVTRGRWTKLKLSSAPRPVPAGVGLRWIDNARTEHASVAAFARLTLDLMALGAPPELLKATQKDALDEIRHTELCFALARSLGAEDVGPAAFPQARPRFRLPSVRKLSLAELAVDSLLDGALHEGVSARVVARLTKRCSDPLIGDVLREIAADEGRHAAHGWEVVRFCLSEGGEPVAKALLGALAGLPDVRPGDSENLGGEDGSWEEWGLPGRKLEDEEYARAAADLKVRVRALVETQLPS